MGMCGFKDVVVEAWARPTLKPKPLNPKLPKPFRF